MAGAGSGIVAQENNRKSGLKSIDMWPENWFWKEGWVQKKLFDIGWSDESDCQACHKAEGTEKQRLYHSPERHETRWKIPEAFRKSEQKARPSKELKWQRGTVTHPL